jgi:hypothetical protein
MKGVRYSFLCRYRLFATAIERLPNPVCEIETILWRCDPNNILKLVKRRHTAGTPELRKPRHVEDSV